MNTLDDKTLRRIHDALHKAVVRTELLRHDAEQSGLAGLTVASRTIPPGLKLVVLQTLSEMRAMLESHELADKVGKAMDKYESERRGHS